MKTLVIGSGGREHAIVWALKKNAVNDIDIYCAPGNAGIEEIARCIPIAVGDQSGLLKFARSEGIELTFVGPEAPLAEGIVDSFRESGLRIAGPTKAAAQLEASKVMAKDFMSRHSIPTAAYRVVSSASDAVEVLRSGIFGDADSTVVIKADGLAAGKGVVVASSREEAERAVVDLTSGALVSVDAAKQIIIEEALQGTEASVLVFADGQDYRLMPAARDHKRIGENDTGPNTGGMGAVTDSSILDESTLQHVRERIIEPTIEGAGEDGFPFSGVLFVGLMLTQDGPKVLEYNVRFGDPEAQAILMRLDSDLSEVFRGIAEGNLRNVPVNWCPDPSACVVLASKGYPGKYETGAVISGLDKVRHRQTVEVFHAGTKRTENGQFVTAGGRVLAVTATGSSLPAALDKCYEAISDINWDGMQYRRDIGKRHSGVAA
jgi:phosphoribosylamine--glycine ligase